MPRLNIEEELHRDQRFIDLVMKMGSREAALGALALCWSVAQAFWKQSDNGIPKSEWKKQRLREEIIAVGLAEDRGDFIYVRGARERFAWLRQRAEAGQIGGKKSGKARRENIEENPKRNEAKRSGAKLLSSSSSSPSPSSSGSHSIIQGEQTVMFENEPREIRSPIGYFVAAYVNCYRQRYGERARPPLGGKVQGQIKGFLKETPLQRSCELIQAYLEMNDAWFLNKGHDFATFLANQAKVSLALDTGARMNLGKAREIERVENNADTWERAAAVVNAAVEVRHGKV